MFMVQGIEPPRVAPGGTDLPSARQEASALFPDVDVPDNHPIRHAVGPQIQFSNSCDLQSK